MTHKPQRRSLPLNLQEIHPTHINYSARGGRSSAVTSCQSRALRPEVRALPRGRQLPKYHHAVHEEVNFYLSVGCWLVQRRWAELNLPNILSFSTSDSMFIWKQNHHSQSKPVDPLSSPCRLGAPAVWKEFPSEMRQRAARCERSLCSGGYITVAVNRCRCGRPRCRTQPDSPFRLYPAPEITQRTPRRAPEATTQTRLVRFHISYALFEPRGKSDAARAANLDRPH